MTSHKHTLGDFIIKYTEQDRHTFYVNCDDTEVQSDSLNAPENVAFDKERDFPSLSSNNAIPFDTTTPHRESFKNSWQLKYTKKQSVGESNGFEIQLLKHVQQIQNQGRNSQKQSIRKPLIKNRSTTRYRNSGRIYTNQTYFDSYKYHTKIEAENPFSLLLNEPVDGLEESSNYEIESSYSNNESGVLSKISNVKNKRKRSHPKKRNQKRKPKSTTPHAPVAELESLSKVLKTNESYSQLSDSEKDEKIQEVVIDISVVPSQPCNSIVYSDNRDKIPLLAIYRFVSERTGVAVRNMYFKNLSGQYIEKQSYLSPDTENLIMYFKLRGGGRRKKGDMHHPGTECGPCIVCGKSGNRYFHLIDRQGNEAMLDYFKSLLPGISNNDCICKSCETSFKNKSKAKRSKTDPPKGNMHLCDLASYGICQNQKYRSLQLNQKQLSQLFDLRIDQPKDDIISVHLCKQHHLQYFKSKNKCVICSKPFLPDQKKYYFPESVFEFAELYLASIPGSDAPTAGRINQSSTVCSGCDYAVRKFMVDNYKSAGGTKNYDNEIENVKQIWTQLACTDSKPGLSFCILACCDAFLEHRPILLAELFQLFWENSSEGEKTNANQRMLLQKIVEIFENSITIVTDDYKRMGTMIKRTDNNDNKTIHTALYNDFSEAGKKKVPESEIINTNDTLVKASKILQDRLLAQKHLLNTCTDTFDIENFDPYHFILKNCDPMLFNFISSLQGETISNFVQNMELDKLKSKGLSCLNIISCILFSSDLSCKLPLPMLISDVIDKYTNSSSDCLRILNQFGICYSKTSLKRYQNSVIERKNEVGVQVSLESFTICSVDNINKRSSYAAVKSSDASRGFDGTSVQLVEPMPVSIKWSANEVNQELAVCTTVTDNEGIKYKKLEVGSLLSLFRSISAICFSGIRHTERDQNGNILCSEISLEDDKICSILSSYVNN